MLDVFQDFRLKAELTALVSVLCCCDTGDAALVTAGACFWPCAFETQDASA